MYTILRWSLPKPMCQPRSSPQTCKGTRPSLDLTEAWFPSRSRFAGFAPHDLPTFLMASASSLRRWPQPSQGETGRDPRARIRIFPDVRGRFRATDARYSACRHASLGCGQSDSLEAPLRLGDSGFYDSPCASGHRRHEGRGPPPPRIGGSSRSNPCHPKRGRLKRVLRSPQETATSRRSRAPLCWSSLSAPERSRVHREGTCSAPSAPEGAADRHRGGLGGRRTLAISREITRGRRPNRLQRSLVARRGSSRLRLSGGLRTPLAVRTVRNRPPGSDGRRPPHCRLESWGHRGRRGGRKDGFARSAAEPGGPRGRAGAPSLESNDARRDGRRRPNEGARLFVGPTLPPDSRSLSRSHCGGSAGMGRLATHWRVIASSLFSIFVLSAFILYSNSLAPTTSRVAPMTPIEHIVVIMKENHAFDNYFGTFPGVDGIPSNITVLDAKGGLLAPHWLNATWTWDLPHSREAMLTSYNGGRNDGFAIAADSLFPGLGAVAMGYYDRREVGAYLFLAEDYTLADRYFQSMFGPPIPNSLYSLAGQAGDPTTNLIKGSGVDFPTIRDPLEAHDDLWEDFASEGSGHTPLPAELPHIRSNCGMVSKIVP